MYVGPDRQRAVRKLSQIGYYRLSGFWYPCREIEIDSQGEVVLDGQTGKPMRLDAFMPGTSLQGILDIYLYDKRLRLAVLDAIERIEVHIRTVIAHELGRLDPVAHTKASFINQRFLQDYQDRKSRKTRNTWNEWLEDHGKHLSRCSEDCILWHKQNDKTMPFWVVVEAWSFGLASRYFGLLKRRHQLEIAKRFEIDNPKVLGDWLRGISDFRNRCAHHSRVWNYASKNPLPMLKGNEFMEHWIDDEASLQRLYGASVVIARLIKTIGPNSKWFKDFGGLIDQKPELPGCDFTALGIMQANRFPHELFGR